MLPVQRKLHVGGCCRRCCLPHCDRRQAYHEVNVNGIRTFAIAIITALLLGASAMPDSKGRIAFIFILMLGFMAFMISVHAPQKDTRAITATISIFSAAVAFCLYVSLYLPPKLQWVSYLMFGLIMVWLLFGEPNCQSFLKWIYGRIKVTVLAPRPVAPPATGAQSSFSVEDSEASQTSINVQVGAVVVANV